MVTKLGRVYARLAFSTLPIW